MAMAPDPVPISNTRPLGRSFRNLSAAFHQMFCLRPRNQDIGIYEEVAPEEFLTMRDVLGWLTFKALVQIPSVVNPGKLGQFVSAVRIKIGAFAVHGVAQ